MVTSLKFELFEYEQSFGTSAQLPKSDLIEIAFAGRSNVGKSSAINKLLNRKSLARVSATPGKTATVNFFRGNDIRLVDLPGYGYAKITASEKKRWAELMEGYFNSGRNIELVIQLVDMRHPPSKDDLDMMNFLSGAGYSFAVIMTKCDKLNKTEFNNRLEKIKTELAAFGELKTIPYSSLNGTGVPELRALIEEYSKEET